MSRHVTKVSRLFGRLKVEIGLVLSHVGLFTVTAVPL